MRGGGPTKGFTPQEPIDIFRNNYKAEEITRIWTLERVYEKHTKRTGTKPTHSSCMFRRYRLHPGECRTPNLSTNLYLVTNVDKLPPPGPHRITSQGAPRSLARARASTD